MAEKKLTFFSKKDFSCPVCDTVFKKEEILSGGGRMNAGNLTDELHRHYNPTVKYGDIFPLLYPLIVCPMCFSACSQKDFDEMPPETISALDRTIGERKSSIKAVFPDLDFSQNRDLPEGIASYILAMMSYDHFPAEFSPTFQQGLAALRGAWLCGDLHKQKPSENFDYLQLVMYRKAAFLYSQVLVNEQTGGEKMERITQYGPDIDNNYGYDGILYLAGLLEFKYGQKGDPQKRMTLLTSARSTVSRIVGMGKSSKSKPSAILDLARDLHKGIKDELKALEEAG